LSRPRNPHLFFHQNVQYVSQPSHRCGPSHRRKQR
jgi:hypothetical protein